MKLILLIVLALLCFTNGSVIPVATTYAIPATPVATSYQVVARNFNRAYVPAVPAVSTVGYPLTYPGYTTTWNSYPYNYRHGYNYGYPYGYSYGYPYSYGHTVW